jgi:predicted transcriptional regulator
MLPSSSATIQSFAESRSQLAGHASASSSRRRATRPVDLEKAFGGDVAALLAHFVAEASLDRDQVEQLRQLLSQKKNSREKRT